MPTSIPFCFTLSFFSPVQQPKAESPVAPGMVIDDPSDSVELACKELAEQLPKLSPDEASALLTKRLRLVLMNHIDQFVDLSLIHI